MLAIPHETQKAHNLLVRLLDHGSRKRPPWSKKTKSCCVIGCYGYDYGYVRKNLLRTFGTCYQALAHNPALAPAWQDCGGWVAEGSKPVTADLCKKMF